MKDKLNSEVWIPEHWDNEAGLIRAICWGKVIRQTSKSIWIQDQFNVIEKWNIQEDGLWKCPSKFGNMKKHFKFKLDPLIQFISSKEAA